MIADQIHANEVIADIGTDHAYIPIYLVKEGVCSHVLCSDIHNGPFEIAQDNVKSYGLSDQIDVRLGGGLSPYKKGEMQTIIMAGMGGEMIVKILQEDRPIALSVSRFILQPMTALDELRSYLYQNGFNIVKEHLAKEGNKYYVIMDVIWDRTEVPSIEYLYIGKGLLQENSENLRGYLEHLERCWSTAVEGMKQSNVPQSRMKIYQYLLVKIKEFQKKYLNY